MFAYLRTVGHDLSKAVSAWVTERLVSYTEADDSVLLEVWARPTQGPGQGTSGSFPPPPPAWTVPKAPPTPQGPDKGFVDTPDKAAAATKEEPGAASTDQPAAASTDPVDDKPDAASTDPPRCKAPPNLPRTDCDEDDTVYTRWGPELRSDLGDEDSKDAVPDLSPEEEWEAEQQADWQWTPQDVQEAVEWQEWGGVWYFRKGQSWVRFRFWTANQIINK